MMKLIHSTFPSLSPYLYLPVLVNCVDCLVVTFITSII